MPTDAAPLTVVYDLASDPHLARMQAASREAGPIGLRPTHGVVGTAEWWHAIETGIVPTRTVRGVVVAFWPGHHDDYPEFELQASDGERSTWGCRLDPVRARSVFAPGARVEVDFVVQAYKVPFNGVTSTRCVIRMRAG